MEMHEEMGGGKEEKMSVLVKGMEMPKNCGGCPLRASCVHRIYLEYRPDYCPLIGIPPHGRLIDAGELAKFPIRRDHYDEKNGDIHFINGIETLMEYADCLPTILEAEEADG